MARVADRARRAPIAVRRSPLALGTQLALERGRGRSAVPVLPALIGAIVGVLGVVGALTFRAGLDHGTRDAKLYGQQFQVVATAWLRTRRSIPTVIEAVKRRDPDVATVERESDRGRSRSTAARSPLFTTQRR